MTFGTSTDEWSNCFSRNNGNGFFRNMTENRWVSRAQLTNSSLCTRGLKAIFTVFVSGRDLEMTRLVSLCPFLKGLTICT